MMISMTGQTDKGAKPAGPAQRAAFSCWKMESGVWSRRSRAVGKMHLHFAFPGSCTQKNFNQIN